MIKMATLNESKEFESYKDNLLNNADIFFDNDIKYLLDRKYNYITYGVKKSLFRQYKDIKIEKKETYENLYKPKEFDYCIIQKNNKSEKVIAVKKNHDKKEIVHCRIETVLPEHELKCLFIIDKSYVKFECHEKEDGYSNYKKILDIQKNNNESKFSVLLLNSKNIIVNNLIKKCEKINQFSFDIQKDIINYLLFGYERPLSEEEKEMQLLLDDSTISTLYKEKEIGNITKTSTVYV